MSPGKAKVENTSGSDDIGRLGAVVKSALVTTGVSADTATKYSVFCMEIYGYVLKHPEAVSVIKGAKDIHDTYDGSHKAFVAAQHIERGAAMGLKSARSGFASYGASGGAGVLQVFVDRFEAFAKSQGIELNDCSMQVAKVTLSIAAAGIGSVTALTGFGIVLAGLGVLSTARESYILGQACLTGGTSR